MEETNFNELDEAQQIAIKKEKSKEFWLQTLPTLLVNLFCFLLFPAFIVYAVLTTNYEFTTNKARSEILEKMEHKLNYIEKYCTANKYFHQILSQISDLAQKTKDASEAKQYLSEQIANLKSKYPEQLEFIVWDEHGEIIKELTDRKKFFYLMKKLYVSLEKISNLLEIDPKTNISRIKNISDPNNINSMRSILGKILVPEHLKKPYLHGEESGTLLTEFGEKFSSVWFKIGKKISFLCFFTHELMHSYTSLSKIISSLNKEQNNYICGYSTSNNLGQAETSIPMDLSNSLTLALAKFEGSDNELYEDDNAIISIAMPQPEIRSFCVYRKQKKPWSKQLQIDVKFYQTIILLMMAYCVCYLFISYKQKFISISWKIASLFILANVLPLSILGFIGYKYLYSYSDSLYENKTGTLKRYINEFEENQNGLSKKILIRLNNQYDAINKKLKTKTITDDIKQEIVNAEKIFTPTESCLIASSGEVIFYNKNKLESEDIDIYKEVTRGILNFCNGINYTSDNKLMKKVSDPSELELIRNIAWYNRSIQCFTLGKTDKISYIYLFGDSKNYKNNYMLYLSWNDDLFQTMYVNDYYNKTKAKSTMNIYINSLDEKNRWPNKDFPKEILNQMEGMSEFSDAKNLIININGEECLTAICAGSKLNTMLIAATYPIKLLRQQIKLTQNIILICAIISMLLTVTIGKALIKQFIEPINNLRKATIAVSKQQYNHRIPILDEDEFGRLSEVYNKVIYGLEDFETAKIIQKSILPKNHFVIEQMKIYAQNIIMTTLGGDYYDVIKINENHWGLVMGDVAGHGVSAGLMMAMAKAAILSSTEIEQMDPSVLTAKLHKMFFSIKNEKIKRMMTFQYFMVEPKTNTFTFVNAGHCFPLIVHPKTKQAEFIEHMATPLGIGPRARYKNLVFTLEPGDSLVLYTDGIAEAKNEKGEEYTFERLRRNIPDLYDPNPETFYKNIYGLYENWSAKPDDDYTVMVINNV